jgi:hypothetical protein
VAVVVALEEVTMLTTVADLISDIHGMCLQNDI